VKLLVDKGTTGVPVASTPAAVTPVVEAVATKPPVSQPTETKRRAPTKRPAPTRPARAKPALDASFVPLGVRVAAAEREALSEALGRTSGNLSQAAALLEVDRNTLKRKMAEHGFPR
jgi:DNA-binding NtrC family response regulator